MSPPDPNTVSALDGLRILEFSNSRVGGHIGQLLADFGAEVILVEPPGGCRYRADPAFSFWARGKRSVELDLRTAAGLETAHGLIAGSDVLSETFRPGVMDRLGLGYERVSAINPAIVYSSVTGFGRLGPHAHLKGYEGVVAAKLGGFHVFGPAVSRPGPAYASVPYCSFSASQTALHGILTALYERERSGRGQWVETNLVQALAAHDPWRAISYIITSRYPEAYFEIPWFANGVPNSPFVAQALVGLSADGRWLQFSAVRPKLFKALLRVMELDWMLDDPEWSTTPSFDDVDKRVTQWERLLEAARRRTVAEWQEVFDREPDVWAELFRRGSELLDHPQMVHDKGAVVIEDPALGPVRQPGPLVRLDATPARLGGPAPGVGAHGPQLGPRQPGVAREDSGSSTVSGLPLEGVTILELGTMFAGPYGATLLTDFGARVVKVEPLDGDPIRSLMPFPEAGGAKVLQGKESVAADLATPEGRQIVHDLARRADLVVQSFRAGVAERLGVDAQSLREVNPNLVYVNAPGYGVDGPCGYKPAFAPTIAAGGGLAMRNADSTILERDDLTLDQIKTQSFRLISLTNPAFAQPDGMSALAVTTAMLLGLLARTRGAGGQVAFTSMLNTVAHALSDQMVEYEGRKPVPAADPELFGLNALYRLYETAEGWVFLAVTTESEWTSLVGALESFSDLGGDPRFSTAHARSEHDAELVARLAAVFVTRSSEAWEKDLTAEEIACVRVVEEVPERILQSDFGRECGYITDVEHPTFGEHPRLTPLVRFSRSEVTAKPGCLVGQHTEPVLRELGYPDEQIKDLQARGLIRITSY